MLATYLALTTAYTFYLKSKLIVDIIVLASLYTLRVIGGAVAVATVCHPSGFSAFSMFIFTSLALIKRYVDLSVRIDGDLPDPSNRNYRKSDLSTIGALAAASGLNAVTIFALYISSDTVHRLYRHPHALWLIPPVLMYWIARALILADRRLMNDDPIVFALKDRNSLLAVGLIGAHHDRCQLKAATGPAMSKRLDRSFLERDDVLSWGRVVRKKQYVAHPQFRDEVPRLIATPGWESKLAIGLRRSYGNSCLNSSGAVIDATGLNRFIMFDPQNGRLRAEAGVSLSSLLQLVVPSGWFLPTTPGTRFVTLGGAVANDVHGKNHHQRGDIRRECLGRRPQSE